MLQKHGIIWKLFLTHKNYKSFNNFVVSELRSETKGSRFESGCQLCAEASSLQ